jgi:hypothetical protein
MSPSFWGGTFPYSRLLSVAGGGEMKGIVMWGLADYFVDEVIEVYRFREQAEHALEQVLEDEPDWKGMLAVVPVHLVEFSLN